MKIFILIVSLFYSFTSLALYLPARSSSELLMSFTADQDTLTSVFDPNEEFSYKDIVVSAHLLKRNIGTKFDIVTNYHLYHKKGMFQTQLVYHLCCEEKDYVYFSVLGGLTTDIELHGGGAVELLFNSLSFFVAIDHTEELRIGLMWYFGPAERFRIGLVADLLHGTFHNKSQLNGKYHNYYGIILGFHPDKRGESAIKSLTEGMRIEDDSQDDPDRI